MSILAALLTILAVVPAAPASSSADPAALQQASLEQARLEEAWLEQAWHACLRESFARQPPAQSRAGSQRSALDACKAREDAFVASLMAARVGKGEAVRTGVRSLPARALAWAASVAATVVDPVSSWIDRLRN